MCYAINESRSLKIAFFGTPSLGHIKPTLNLVRSLISIGCEVNYFNNVRFRKTIEQSGAIFIDYRSVTLHSISIPISELLPHEVTIKLQKYFIASAMEIIPLIIKVHNEKHFDIIIYDQMAFWGQILADQYKLPAFCSNTMLLFDYNDIIRQQPELPNVIDAEYNATLQLLQQYNINTYQDLLELQTAMRAPYIIVYYSKILKKCSDVFKNCPIIYLGNRFDNIVHQIRVMPLVDNSIVYVSLGTVFNDKVLLFKLLASVLSTLPYKIIISAGNNEKIFTILKEFVESENVQIYKFIDQVAVLKKTSLFITHAGFNSICEGITFAVPMLMIPHAPEQYCNAMQMQKLGVGYLLKKHEYSKDGLAKAIMAIKNNWCNYNNAALNIRDSFLKSDNNISAAQKIIRVCSNSFNSASWDYDR